MRNKYRNQKTTINGIKFDSKAEANRYLQLVDMHRRGDIAFLHLQPRFLLLEAFKLNGKTYRKIEYIADFEYKIDGKRYVEDVKGRLTEAYKLKKKLFLNRYGQDLIFVEVQGRNLRSSLGG